MARRTDILNYLVTLLSKIRTRDLNSANAVAQVTEGVVTNATLDFEGIFYDSATVTIEDPGKVQANAIAVLSGDSVSSVTVDQPGGIYQRLIQLLTQLGGLILTQSGDSLAREQEDVPTVIFSPAPKITANVIPSIASGNIIFSVDEGGGDYISNPSITLQATRTSSSFVTDPVKFGSHAWSVNSSENKPFNIPAADYGVLSFWVWPNSEIETGYIPFMRVGGDQHNGVVLFIQNFSGNLRFGMTLEEEPANNQNSSVAGLTANSWNFVSYQVQNAGGNKEDIFVNVGGSGAGRSGVQGYKLVDDNVQILASSSAEGKIYIDDMYWYDSTTPLFPIPTTANAAGALSYLYENFDSPSNVTLSVSTNAAISSNTVVAVSSINTDFAFTSATVTSVEAPTLNIAAQGVATVNSGFSITSIAVTNGGRGYTEPPSITIREPDRALEPATGTVRVSRGVVESIDITFGSQQYLFTPNISITPSSVIFNTSAAQVFRQQKYLDEINDFPTITLSGNPREDLLQTQSGQPFHSMTQSIRGYVNTGYELDSLYESENLARDIETVIDRYADMASNLGVERAQVRAFNTDEGLLTPYGLCELEVEILYNEENS